LLLLAALTFVSCAGSGVVGPLTLVPMETQGEKFSRSDGAVRFQGPEFAVSMKPMGHAAIAGEYEKSGLILPYGSGEEALLPYTFFSLRIENSSSSKIFFNPMRISAFTNKGKLMVPIEVSDIYRLDTGEKDNEARIGSFRKTTFDGTQDIVPGGSVERYLVFSAPQGKVKRFEVLINDLYLGTESHDLVFLFEPLAEEKKK
jgi:hypothetical protein